MPPFREGIKKTLVFDLDETLVHCIENPIPGQCDHVVTVTFPNGEQANAGINIRPHVFDCLKAMYESFQLVLFTASHQAYADTVLELIDPSREIFDLRLYRESCIYNNGVYIKDLRIFEGCRDLADVLIVDNAVYSFGNQLENGVPIIPFYNDPEDAELIHLAHYLQIVANDGGDVREHNRKAFQLA